MGEREAAPAPGDVVRGQDEAAALERPPLIVLEGLEAHLDERGLGAGPVEAALLAGGHSNATFAIRRGDWRAVLRRPPRPPLPPGAHDVLREARLLRALEPADVPTPRILSICESPEPIGAPFMVMEHIDGHVLETDLPGELGDPPERRRIAESFVDVVVAVHAVDVDALGLEWLGRSGGYLERQLKRFSGSWEANRTRELPAIAELERLLRESVPESGPTTLVHGDVRIGNAIYASGPPGRVAALLDWEMSTLGDPLADLGYLCAAWTDPSDARPPMFHVSPLTGAAGFPTRAELIARYEERSGRRATSLAWYTALAYWKSAVFMEGNYRRAITGMSDDPFLLGFRDGVDELAELGLEAVTRARAGT